MMHILPKSAFIILFIFGDTLCYAAHANIANNKPKTLSPKKAQLFLEEVYKISERQSISLHATLSVVNRGSNSSALASLSCIKNENSTVISFEINQDEFQIELNTEEMTTLKNGNKTGNYETFSNLTPLSPIDLQYFLLPPKDLKYLCASKAVGRPAQVFEYEESANISGTSFSRIKIYIDNSWKIPLQIDFLNSKNAVTRRLAVRSFKKVGSEWTLKTFEISDFRSKKSTKLTIIDLS
jgi:hypothetical protein